MSGNRLSDLAIISMEQEIALSLNLTDVVTKFAKMHGNRRIDLY